jgi:hypothetical protein
MDSVRSNGLLHPVYIPNDARASNVNNQENVLLLERRAAAHACQQRYARVDNIIRYADAATAPVHH